MKKFQKTGVKRLNEFKGRALLADEMGLGKTIQALSYAVRLNTSTPVVIVCPASLKAVWESELKQHFGLSCEVLEGRRKPRVRIRLNEVPKFIVVNYDILKSWLPQLKKLRPSLLLLDEAHFLKNSNIDRTRATKSLARVSKRVIAISGTPLTNRPIELHAVIQLVRPDLFPSRLSYAFRYCYPRKQPWGWEFKGASRLKELHSILNTELMIRRKKADVLKELPAKSRHIIPLAVNLKEYRTAEKDIVAWLRSISIEKAKKAKKAQGLVKIGVLKQLAYEAKRSAVFEWIDNALEQTEDKLVLFCNHRRVLKELEERYGSMMVQVHGGTSKKQRKVNVQRFQTDQKIRLFAGNFKAAGVGLTLTRSSTVAFIEFPWTPGDLSQAEDRVHRIGQMKSASIYFLIARGTIEEDICKLLQDKQKVLDKVLDGESGEHSLSIYKDLLKLIQRKK